MKILGKSIFHAAMAEMSLYDLPDCEIQNAITICDKLVASFEARYPELHLSFGLVAALSIARLMPRS